MALPNQRDVETPLLSAIEEAGGEARPRDLYPAVTARFPDLTDQDLTERLPSGSNRWTNRIQWARQSLVQKGEIVSDTRGVWRITEKGRQRLEREGRIGISTGAEREQVGLHAQLQSKLKEIGEILHKYSTTEYREGPYQYDVVWKDDERLPRATHVFEVQHHGNLADALLKLKHAHDVWLPRLFLVVTGERDRRRVEQMLGPLFSGVFHEISSVTVPLTPEDVEQIHRDLLRHRRVLDVFLTR